MNNYTKIKCCFNCKNRFILTECAKSLCRENIIDKDTRLAKYLEVSYDSVCDIWGI